MIIAVFSDIHDNLARFAEVAKIIEAKKTSSEPAESIEVGICCGDVTSQETLEAIARPFKKLYLAYGNADWQIAQNRGLLPENVMAFEKFGAFELAGRKIAAVHNNDAAEKIAESNIYDIVFYGHTHTPWEKKVGHTTMLNPGEVAGQYGPASFCLYDLSKMTGKLQIIK